MTAETPIERVARFLGTSAHMRPVEVLVPEQCMLLAIKGRMYHVEISEMESVERVDKHEQLRLLAQRLVDLCNTDSVDDDFNRAVKALREELP